MDPITIQAVCLLLSVVIKAAPEMIVAIQALLSKKVITQADIDAMVSKYAKPYDELGIKPPTN